MTSKHVSDPSKFKVFFGKHSGKEFSEIPQNYLEWLLRQDWLKEPLKSQVQAYLKVQPLKRAIEKEKYENSN